MRRKSNSKVRIASMLAAAASFAAVGVVQAAPIAPGDLVVVRVGDGATTFNGSASAVSLLDYSITYSGNVPTAVTLAQAPIALQTTVTASGNRALTQGGTAAGEG